jgi:hypothetical protein
MNTRLFDSRVGYFADNFVEYSDDQHKVANQVFAVRYKLEPKPGDLDKYKKSKQTEEDRQKAINNAIYNSLVWSLKSNCNQHELVLSYCKWANQYEKLTDAQGDELKKIITK